MGFIGILIGIFLTAMPAFSAYHHEGEKDTNQFLTIYPDKKGTKLDHCALCHGGGEYERKPGRFVYLGSCQWCHHAYGYNASGNITETLNPYGMAYYANGRNAAAIKTIESLDSDQDGFSNSVEIRASRFPGDNRDNPDKKPAPRAVYSRSQLENMQTHTQFLLMNTSRSGDYYAEYTGISLADLLNDAGILPSATGITVYAPDGWSQYHPLDKVKDPELYHVKGIYPQASYNYDPEAKQWCDYSAPGCAGRNHGDPIFVDGGLKTILAYKRDGAYLSPGVLNSENKLEGEGPFRLIVPQKVPCPPDQSSKSNNQNVCWPYNPDWDHNGGASTRSATIIKVEPLPPGTTDINAFEAGWKYVDGQKIIVYGAITGKDGGTSESGSSDSGSDSSSGCFVNTVSGTTGE